MDLDHQISIYLTHEKPLYEHYRLFLESVLRVAQKIHAPLGIVQARVKTPTSFAEKCLRKAAKYSMPVYELTDLCGARFVVQSHREAEELSRWVRRHFVVDEKNSEDLYWRLRTSEFGYRAVHFVVQTPPDFAARMPLSDEQARWLESINAPDRDGQPRARRAEIQVRTGLQQVWADAFHDRLYKTRFRLPSEYQRAAARLAARMEAADDSFTALGERLDAFVVDYGAYLKPEEMSQEIELLRGLLAQPQLVEGKAGIALRLAKIAKAREQWEAVVELAPFASGADPDAIRLRAEIGNAQCRRQGPASPEYDAGQNALREIAQPQSLTQAELNTLIGRGDHLTVLARKLAGSFEGLSTGGQALVVQRDDFRAQVMACLAWSVYRARRTHTHLEEVRDLYYQAHLLSPDNPYLLTSFLEAQLRCEGDRGYAQLMWPHVESAIAKCREHVAVGIELPFAYFAMAKLHFLLGRTHECALAYARGLAPATAPAVILEQLKDIGDLKEILQKRAPALAADLDKIRRLLALGFAVKNEEWKLAAPSFGACQPPVNFNRLGAARDLPGPVVIIAGGADERFSRLHQTYTELLREALGDFQGTVFSGGTTWGIPGLVGQISRELGPAKRFCLRGYLPKRFGTAGVLKDPEYVTLETDGDDFSVLEPIQNWIDLIAAGTNPRSVRVLGIGGGLIAQFEYNLAVALGAAVGLVEESGRKADETLTEQPWWGPGRLLALPCDPATVRAFLNTSPSEVGVTHVSVGGGEPIDLEPAARQIHEKYRESVISDWEHAPEDFRRSCFHQAAYWMKAVETFGLTVDRLDPARPGIIFDLEACLGEQGLERLAAMEHGRWNVERLVQGWRLGPKDVARRISPYLLPWSALSEETKKFDRDAARGLPEAYRKIGLAIYRKP